MWCRLNFSVWFPRCSDYPSSLTSIALLYLFILFRLSPSVVNCVLNELRIEAMDQSFHAVQLQIDVFQVPILLHCNSWATDMSLTWASFVKRAENGPILIQALFLVCCHCWTIRAILFKILLSWKNMLKDHLVSSDTSINRAWLGNSYIILFVCS